MPAGKAIAMAAMPTAVLMGMGFTPTLALADDAAPSLSNSLTADEYKACVAALEEDASASPSAGADESTDETAQPTPSPSSSAGTSGSSGSSDASNSSGSSGTSGDTGSSGDSSSSDSGSDDAAEPTPTPSASQSSEAQSGDAATPAPAPSASETGGNLLEDIGDALTDIVTGGNEETQTPSPTPTPSTSSSTSEETAAEDGGKDTPDAAEKTTDEVTGEVADTVRDTVQDPTEAASDTASEAAGDATEAADEATASPSPSAGATTDPEDCPTATDDEGGVDNKLLVPDDPWYLEASSLLLKGADYQGIVEVRTAGGKTKKVLKYVISDGTDIGDLHQLVKDRQSGKTHHVQAAKGSTSTIRDGKTVMYTESISGNLLGLIPVTFDPEHPPPLNIPLIYFTKVKVTQAGQFGGTLHVPGMHTFTTD